MVHSMITSGSNPMSVTLPGDKSAQRRRVQVGADVVLARTCTSARAARLRGRPRGRSARARHQHGFRLQKARPPARICSHAFVTTVAGSSSTPRIPRLGCTLIAYSGSILQRSDIKPSICLIHARCTGRCGTCPSPGAVRAGDRSASERAHHRSPFLNPLAKPWVDHAAGIRPARAASCLEGPSHTPRQSPRQFRILRRRRLRAHGSSGCQVPGHLQNGRPRFLRFNGDCLHFITSFICDLPFWQCGCGPIG